MITERRMRTIRSNFFDAVSLAEMSVKNYVRWTNAFEDGYVLPLNRREDSGAVSHNLKIGVRCIRHKDWFFFLLSDKTLSLVKS